jgi:hypothetical protein
MLGSGGFREESNTSSTIWTVARQTALSKQYEPRQTFGAVCSDVESCLGAVFDTFEMAAWYVVNILAHQQIVLVATCAVSGALSSVVASNLIRIATAAPLTVRSKVVGQTFWASKWAGWSLESRQALTHTRRGEIGTRFTRCVTGCAMQTADGRQTLFHGANALTNLHECDIACRTNKAWLAQTRSN